VVGPVMIPKSNFPATIAAYSNIGRVRTNELYYLPVSGHDNLILVFPWTATLSRPSIGSRMLSPIYLTDYR
jgi:hypothetical protein